MKQVYKPAKQYLCAVVTASREVSKDSAKCCDFFAHTSYRHMSHIPSKFFHVQNKLDFFQSRHIPRYPCMLN